MKSDTPRMDAIGLRYAGPEVSTSKIDWQAASVAAFVEGRKLERELAAMTTRAEKAEALWKSMACPECAMLAAVTAERDQFFEHFKDRCSYHSLGDCYCYEGEGECKPCSLANCPLVKEKA